MYNFSMAREYFVATGDRNYPSKAAFSMRAEDFVGLTGISSEILPSTADHVEIGVWTGTPQTGFYEDAKPGGAPQAQVVSADQYLDTLAEVGLPLPPQGWVSERDIHISNMGILSNIDVPSSPDDYQGRVINTAQRQAPPAREGVLFVAGKSTRDYVDALVDAGFPREAFAAQAAPAVVETLGKGGLAVVRAFGGLRNTPAPEGQLTVVVRTLNRRPSGKPQV